MIHNKSRKSCQLPRPALFTGIGIATKVENLPMLDDSGLDFITLSTSGFLMPEKAVSAFAEKLADVKKHRPPVLAVNSFIRPKHLKCVGPEANHDDVMAWAETVFRRAEMAGVKFVVFGSNGARRDVVRCCVEFRNGSER